MKCSTDSWKLKILGDVPIFKSLFDLLLEYDQFVLHLGVDVAFVISGPEAPEGVADDVAEACLLFSEDVLSELGQDVLPLQQLLPDLLLLPQLPFVQNGLGLLHGVGDRRHGDLGVTNGILEDELLDPALVALVLSSLLVVLATSIHRWILRPRHGVDLLISQASSVWASSYDLDRSLPRWPSFPRACLLVLIHLPFELHGIRKRTAMWPLLTLCILLVDLLQVYFVMLVLLLRQVVPSIRLVAWIFHHRSGHDAIIATWLVIC